MSRWIDSPAWSDGTCEFCEQGLQTSCLHGGWWGGTELDGGQGDAVRVPETVGRSWFFPSVPITS
jgi:threonine dehydrogenase-like Zn-dependent dehydrogenase